MNQSSLSENVKPRRFMMSSGNKKEINSTSGTRPQLIDGYSICANCPCDLSVNPALRMCVPNLLAGNVRQKNNNVLLEPRITFVETIGQIGLGAYNRTNNIF